MHTCHVSHLIAGATAVHEQHGLKNKKLKDVSKKDGTAVKAASVKIQKTHYYVNNYNEDAKLKKWQTQFFSEAAADEKDKAQKPSTPQPKPAAAKVKSPKVEGDPKVSEAASKPERFQIEVHTKDLAESMTVGLKAKSIIPCLFWKFWVRGFPFGCSHAGWS